MYLLRTKGWKNIPERKAFSLYDSVKIINSSLSFPEYSYLGVGLSSLAREYF